MTERIQFANQLRGLAAAGVVVSHLVGVYWIMPDAVSSATLTLPPDAAPIPSIHPWAVAISSGWFNFGPFGVGLFFLISGLVIPFSLREHTRGSFLLARLLRIYPTYCAAVLLDVGLLWANAAANHVPFAVRPGAILANALLIQDFTGHWSLDLVNWTLCVELRFYVLMALCAPLIRRGNVPVLFAIGVAALLLNGLTSTGALGPSVPDPTLLSYTVSTESMFVTFMLIGVVLHYHGRGQVGAGRAALAVAGLFALFLLCWPRSVLAAQWPGVPQNYGLALLVFAGLYGVRRSIPALPPLDRLAAISYPIYILHPLLGFSVLRLLQGRWHWPYEAALAAAVAAILIAAAALHLLVERPTVALGRRLRHRVVRPVLTGAAAE